MGSDGTPTGYLKEQAGTYTRSFRSKIFLCACKAELDKTFYARRKQKA